MLYLEISCWYELQSLMFFPHLVSYPKTSLKYKAGTLVQGWNSRTRLELSYQQSSQACFPIVVQLISSYVCELVLTYLLTYSMEQSPS